MTDLFEEVEEQLRSDRYRSFGLRALPWIVGVVAAVLIGFLGYWGWTSYRTHASAKASESYQAALDALAAGRKTQAEQLFGEVSKSASGGYKALALMQLAGFKVEAGDAPGAVKLFDQAADAAPDDVIGDAARLKSAFAVLDTAPYSEVEARLTPLMKDGHPYRVQAREALAFAKLMKGDAAGARTDFSLIAGSIDAPDGARQRAHAAMDLIDSGSAKAVPAAVKAAAALTPSDLAAPAPTAPGIAPAQQPQASGPQ